MKRTKCIECGCDLKYKVVEENYLYEEDDLRVEYKGKKAICESCGKEISIDEIENYNQEQFEKAYKEINDIITIEDIEKILVKYDIGKRVLSKLLGLGEITITRYLEGYIPTTKNSNYLKKILNDEEYYYSILLKNGHLISKLAYKKTANACEKLLNLTSGDQALVDVAQYILSNVCEITNLMLQKLLYYVQLFGMMLNDEVVFKSNCKAWKHGPVYGEIYYLFKDYGAQPISENIENTPRLDSKIKSIVDGVINSFSCYSGNVLTYFTHSEDPWINTETNDVIETECMFEFAKKIQKENKIKSVNDIEIYSKKMFEKYRLKFC